MAVPAGPARSGPPLIIASAILSIAMVICALFLSRSIGTSAPPVPPTYIQPRAASAPVLETAPAIARVGPGQVVLADGKGNLFLMGAEREDGSPGLVLHRVYRLREDPSRHQADPERKSPAGWYLDDLAADREERIRAIRERFEALVATGAPSVEAVDSLAALARELARGGDIAYLTERLGDPSYLARRSAGIALGEKGWPRATPGLIEVARKGDKRSRKVAGNILAKLTGIPAPTEVEPEPWGAAIKKWEGWWEEHQ